MTSLPGPPSLVMVIDSDSRFGRRVDQILRRGGVATTILCAGIAEAWESGVPGDQAGSMKLHSAVVINATAVSPDLQGQRPPDPVISFMRSLRESTFVVYGDDEELLEMIRQAGLDRVTVSNWAELPAQLQLTLHLSA